MNVGQPRNTAAVASANNPAEELGNGNLENSQKERTKKKPWSLVEDALLSLLIEAQDLELGQGKRRKWADIAIRMNGRTGKQCRERWNYQLRPELKKGQWTMQEDATIFVMQREIGNQWSRIAKSLPGRTDNDIKNRWHSVMRTAEKGTLDILRSGGKKRPLGQGINSPPSKLSRLEANRAHALKMKSLGSLPNGGFKDPDPFPVEDGTVAGSLFSMNSERTTDHPPIDMDMHPPTDSGFEDTMGLSIDTFTPGMPHARTPFIDSIPNYVDAPSNWHDDTVLAASSLFSMTPRAETSGGAVKSGGSTKSRGKDLRFWAV